MIRRGRYLDRIRPFYDQRLIKVITGVRRSGKSVLLDQICADLEAEGVAEANITHIDLELIENKELRQAENLYEHIVGQLEENMNYVLLDEIQLVPGFQDVVNSLQARGDVSVFITGSNSSLLSGEMATLLAGRYASFRMMPFCFKEYREFQKERGSGANYPYDYAPTDDQLLYGYLRWGGFPLVCEQNTDDARLVVLSDLYTSIVLKDILDRGEVSKSGPLQEVLDYLMANSSCLVSGKRIADTLTSGGVKISAPTVYEYLRYIGDSYAMSFADRYAIEGKEVLRQERKAYVCDLGFIHLKKSRTKDEHSLIMETTVYNELLSRGYEVRVGKTRKGEIGFIVSKGQKRCYIQVAYLMHDEATIERELGAFKHFRDSHPKYVISMDPLTSDINGVRHLRLIDFLLDETLLVLG